MIQVNDRNRKTSNSILFHIGQMMRKLPKIVVVIIINVAVVNSLVEVSGNPQKFALHMQIRMNVSQSILSIGAEQSRIYGQTLGQVL